MIIAVMNQKGGAGKTTTAQNLAAALSKFHNKQTLLVDTDAQANLTLASGLEITESNSLYDVLTRGTKLSAAIMQNAGGCGYDLLPADRRLWYLEQKQAAKFPQKMKEAAKAYDFVIIDCAPALSSMSANSILASEAVIVPMEPHYLNQTGLANLLETITELNPELIANNKVKVVFTRCERSKHAAGIIADTVEQFGNVFDTRVRKNIYLAEAAGIGIDIFQYAPKCNGANDYKALALEVVNL